MSSFRHEDWIVTSTRYCWTVNREIEIASGKMAGQKMLDTHGHYLNLDRRCVRGCCGCGAGAVGGCGALGGGAMNLEVEREVGELAKLRRLRERVMALPEKWRDEDKGGSWDEGPIGNQCAADIDAIAKEVGGE